MSKIRVTFNRPLTWSEVEFFRTSFRDAADYDKGQIEHKYRFTDDRQKLYWEASDFGRSREMYEKITLAVENFFVNLHPVAVRTFSE